MAYIYSDNPRPSQGSIPTVSGDDINRDKMFELGETYNLGEYTFTVTARTIPQTGLMDVIARATGPQGKIGAKTYQVSDTSEIYGWYVEANDTTADVYVNMTETINGPDIPSPFYRPVPCSEGRVVGYYRADSNRVLVGLGENARGTATWSDDLTNGWFTLLLAQTTNPSPFADFLVADSHYGYVQNGVPYTYGGKTVYYARSLNQNYSGKEPPVGYDVNASSFGDAAGPIAWNMIYNNSESDEPKDVLIGRFAITAQEAGATAGTDGEENGWEDVDDGQEPLYPGEPGYPDPEDPDYPGDDMPYFPPSKTLTATVNGALSGRHNDPLNDTSYSYIPADQVPQTQYGSGGIGGNGGGGGAGASTIIVRKFATKKADSKVFILKPKRHGYGSGGGKGGRGGDGCILIYY